MNSRTALGARLFAVLVLALALAGAVACTQSPEAKKQKAVERAEVYLKDGKANEAVIELRNALQIDKDYVPALRALARAYAAKAWYGDAIRELGRAKQLNPDSLPIALELGRAYTESGLFREADEQIERVLAREPKNALALYIRAATRLGQGKPDEALSILDGIIAAGQDVPSETAALRAQVLVRLGKKADAEAAYRAAVKQNPSDVQSLVGLGRTHLERGEYTEAEKLFTNAQAVKPADINVRLGLAATAAGQGKMQDAIKMLEGIDARARTPAVVLALAEYYLRAKQPANASALLVAIVERAPSYWPARNLLGMSYLAGNRPDLAIVHFEELRKQSPGHPVVQYRLAQAYARGGRAREALALLDGLGGKLGKNAGFHLERSRVLLAAGRPDDAYQAASAAQTIAPQSPQPYLLMGQIRAQQGNRKAAQEFFAKAAEVDASFAPAHVALGQIRAAEDDPEGAFKEFDEAVKADPKSVSAARAKILALTRAKRVKEAIQFAETAARAEPGNVGFQSLLASLYVQDKQFEKARGVYEQALKLSPNAVEPRIGLARVALAQQKDEEVISHLQVVLKARPDHPTAVLLLVGVAEKLGRFDQAIATLEGSLKAASGQPTLLLLLADFYVRTGRYQDAITRATEVLATNPDLTGAKIVRARGYLGKRDADAALKDLTEVAKANPKAPGIHLLLGRAHAAMGRIPEAQAAYREALKLDGSQEMAREELAVLSGRKADPAVVERRLAELRRAVEKNPKNATLREGLARALIGANQPQAAEPHLKAILDQAPGHLSANLLMAQLRTQQGKGEDAATHLRTALRTSPQNLEANVWLGRYLVTLGRREEAARLLEAGLRVNPALQDVKLELGVVYLQMGRLADAARVADEVDKALPKSPDPQVLKGMVLLAQNQPKPAGDAFAAALARRPGLGNAHRGLAQSLEAQGQIDRAIDQYRKTLAIQAKDVVALNNLAWLLADKKGQPDEALELATRADQLAPRSAEVADTLGWIQYRRGAYGDAEKSLTRAIGGAPNNAQIQYHLGMTYAKLGKKNDAVSSLRRASQLDPKLAQAEKIADMIKELGG